MGLREEILQETTRKRKGNSEEEEIDMSLIEFKEVSKYYQNPGEWGTALKDVSLNINEQEFVAVFGPSGSGKSTLLQILGGLSHPSLGELWVDGINIYSLKSEKLADYRRLYIGFIFQPLQLLPYLTVLENVTLPLAVVRHVDEVDEDQEPSAEWVQGRRLPDPDQPALGAEPVEELLPAAAKEFMDAHSLVMQISDGVSSFAEKGIGKKDLAYWVMRRVGLADKGGQLPDQLSGEEQERVAIARAMVNNPPIILADEPTAKLDSVTGREIMKLLQELNEEGQTIIMTTHNPEHAEYAHRVIPLKDGRIQQ